MKLTSKEIKILIEVFRSSNGLFLFTLHSNLNLSPKELFSAVENLTRYGLLEVLEDRVSITGEGIAYSVNNSLTTSSIKSKINLTADEFKGRKIEINDFYIPQNFEK